MKITAKTNPEIICEKWREKLTRADLLVKTIEEGASNGHFITSSLEKLEKTIKKLKEIHHAAVEKARYQTTLLAKARRFCFVGGSTVVDAGLQIVTAVFWSKALREDAVDSQDAWVVAGVTLGSLVASKIKNRMYERNKKYFEAISEMEGIIPNKKIIKHYKLVITKYKGGATEGTGAGFQRDDSFVKEKPLSSRDRFFLAAQKVMEGNAAKKMEERYVVKACFVYPRIDNDGVLELTERFKELKKIIIFQENLIQGDLYYNRRANVMAFIDQLDEYVAKLKEVVGDVEFLIKLHERLQKTRSKYIASRFRLTVQLLLELASLIGSIVEVIYEYLGSTSSAAKVAGVSFYVINIVLSWINTGFSRLEQKEVDTLQNLHRIEDQSGFVRDVAKLLDHLKKENSAAELAARAQAEDLEGGLSLLDRPPEILQVMSPLQVKINGLHEQIAKQKGHGRKPTCFTVDELLPSSWSLPKLLSTESSHQTTHGASEQKNGDEIKDPDRVIVNVLPDEFQVAYPVLDDLIFA